MLYRINKYFQKRQLLNPMHNLLWENNMLFYSTLKQIYKFLESELTSSAEAVERQSGLMLAALSYLLPYD